MEAAWGQENTGWENGMSIGSNGTAAGRIRRVDRFRSNYDVIPGRDMAFASRAAGQAGTYGQSGFTPPQARRVTRMESQPSGQGNTIWNPRMSAQQKERWSAPSAARQAMARAPQIFAQLKAQLKARLTHSEKAPRSQRRGRISKPAVLLTCLAIPLLGMGLVGVIGAGEFNRQLQSMGMGFISIDEALSSMRSLAGYTGRSMNDYFTGANAFILFAITQRVPLLIAGAGSLVSGIVSAALHRRKAADQADAPRAKNGSDMEEKVLAYQSFFNR